MSCVTLQTAGFTCAGQRKSCYYKELKRLLLRQGRHRKRWQARLHVRHLLCALRSEVASTFSYISFPIIQFIIFVTLAEPQVPILLRLYLVLHTWIEPNRPGSSSQSCLPCLVLSVSKPASLRSWCTQHPNIHRACGDPSSDQERVASPTCLCICPFR